MSEWIRWMLRGRPYRAIIISLAEVGSIPLIEHGITLHVRDYRYAVRRSELIRAGLNIIGPPMMDDTPKN